MNAFLTTLKLRNEPMFYFGLVCLLSALIFLLAAGFSRVQITGTNAWFKPTKFALSIGVLCWTMGWLMYDLNLPRQVSIYNWVTIILLGFELVYIALQAARGQLSHFNHSTPLYAALYAFMGLAATAVTLHTAYIGILFCTRSFPQLPDYYLLSIRLGIFLFVIFALEGAVMGARNAHTIDGPDGSGGLPFLNWSRRFGDPRIAHFIGMHALQLLPLLAFYLLKDVKLTWFAALVYGAIAVLVLAQALNGRPLVRG
ncbi:hypothetical protein [Mucilaginibacter psychrotolerans]|uniref:Histidine kinase N-terminal 7TM region domain-containing protein n=1 Tax=Mucilaginibacter psychrotolerans TaxID=1524096 RepID=A0A4Y8S6Y0_9SPHI|nr:hypothetical protein [Mucilaginibacter psychrotolerans]TFF34217.1 hypothetical protein E2R66_22800 [Mucilaginibacter psychrotolerans]